jgi:hypothetical protein
MDSEIVDVVTDWESESFSGGIDGLRDLADEEFTGAVTEGTGWLFFLNGRVVGVFDGDLDRFDGASGRAHRAPDPSLPLLFTMLATGGETKAQYYTEDTSLSSADDTLSAGSFTGYVELSENVLSGDYYVVYYGGRKLPCAFLGQSRDIVTGEEAFDRAADEVGIYEVMDVDVEITELPEPAEPDSSAPDSVASEPPDAGGAGAGADEGDTTASEDVSVEETAAEGGDTGEATARDAVAAESPSRTAEAGTDGTATAAESRVGSASGGRGSTADMAPDAEPADTVEPAGATEPGSRGSAAEPPRQPTDGGATATREANGGIEAGAEPSDPDLASEREWQETRTIPSLDPSESSTDGTPDGAVDEESAAVGHSADTTTRGSESDGDSRAAGSRRVSGTDGRESGSEGGQSTRGGGVNETVATLRERVVEVESERDETRRELQQTREQLERRESELERREEELADTRADNEELSERVTELEAEIEGLRDQLTEFEAQQPDGDRELAPAAALSGTNLFVRYDSKSEPTLETAHAETATRAEVEENLRLETHTEFEQAAVVVEGETYDEFLSDTVEYSFVQWVVRELLYELQETGAEGKLKDLYDAIPKIDRAELHGAVELVGEDQKIEGERPFDVILRDRMGEPLVVANVADAREATAEPAVSELIGDAREVAESRDSLGCAAYVSASFFEPRALETATEETGGGLLSRNKRASYVKLARKRGFHLGLVESRDEGFHFTVPEL